MFSFKRILFRGRVRSNLLSLDRIQSENIGLIDFICVLALIQDNLIEMVFFFFYI